MSRFHEFKCLDCGSQGREVRRIDLMRQCPWSIVAHMTCKCGNKWTTYIRDDSRCTPFDFYEDDEDWLTG
ncbi:hypothetical protein JNUCC42_21460 [Brevibacterium sp. JNUCC-42]|nr:hypothetical protein JNUCC42_21460 [Brevibacterium sp. JNUCC-42]